MDTMIDMLSAQEFQEFDQCDCRFAPVEDRLTIEDVKVLEGRDVVMDDDLQ